jgi:hypothetical protein
LPRDPQRRDRLWLLNAFAIALLTLLGAAREALGYDPPSQSSPTPQCGCRYNKLRLAGGDASRAIYHEHARSDGKRAEVILSTQQLYYGLLLGRQLSGRSIRRPWRFWQNVTTASRPCGKATSRSSRLTAA